MLLQHWESSSEGGLGISSEEASLGTQHSNQSSQKSSFLNDLTNAVGNNPVSPPQVSQPKIPSLISAYDQRGWTKKLLSLE